MAEKTKVRQGSDIDQTGAENLAARRAAGGEITSNGVFTKVLRDGKVQVVPTSEIYAKEPDERVQGMEVEDPTVLRHGAPSRTTLVDKAERNFNTQERGDAISKHHAQGAAGTIGREVPTEVKLEEGAFEKDQEKAAKKQAKAREEAAEDSSDEAESDGFDPADPEATTLADLEAALEDASDEDVKKAQKKDGRSGAAAIYERRLAKD